MRKHLWITLFAMLVGVFGSCFSVQAAPAASEEIVVVIDPGHGGTNFGAQYNTLKEKDLTLVTALAMKEELEKYEGVTVQMTRDTDIDLSLEQRAQIAIQSQADYLISLHYNSSTEHNVYGAEVWIPSAGEPYAKSYSLANLVLDELDSYGLFRRGVKTRVKPNGKDYYGLIRGGSQAGIPSIIVEHCHMDHPVDKPIYNSIAKLQAFGRSDATAVAKCLGLSSKELGRDYAGYAKPTVGIPVMPQIQDVTPPVNVKASVAYDERKKGGMLGILIEGEDQESGIVYYSYSVDGGLHWSQLETTPQGTKSITVECKPSEQITDKRMVVRVYNGYDQMAQSAPVAY